MKDCLNIKDCGNRIDEKYKYCQKCNGQYAKDNALIEISKTLRKMNWNLGLRNEFVKQSNPELWNKIKADWKKLNKDEDLNNM